MGQRPLAALCVLVGLALHAGAAEPRDAWIRIASPNFEVVSETGPSETRRVALKLEQFRYVFARMLPGQRLDSPVPTRVIVFRGRERLRPFLPLYRGRPVEWDGYFQGGRDRNHIIIGVDPLAEHPYRIVFHELVHLLLSYSVPGSPAWFQEGLAEYYSRCEIEGGQAALGRPDRRQILTLRRSRLIPLKSFIAVGHGSPLYNEREGRGLFYAQSWAFVHYLVSGRDGEGERQLKSFLEALGLAREHESAFREAFGADLESLEAALERHVRGRSFTYGHRRVDLRGMPPVILSPPAPLSPADVRCVLGDLLLRLGREEEGRARLLDALRLEPGHLPAREALGRLYLERGASREARRRPESALTSAPGSALLGYRYAKAVLEEASRRGPGPLREEEGQRLQALLRAAMEAAPDLHEPYALLADLRAGRGGADKGDRPDEEGGVSRPGAARVPRAFGTDAPRPRGARPGPRDPGGDPQGQRGPSEPR